MSTFPQPPGPAILVRAVQGLAQLALAVVTCLVLASLIPALFGWHSYVVLSGSMAPALNVGDVAVASPARGVDVAPGRVMVFEEPGRPGRVIVHRVQRQNPDGTFTTKGDDNAAADSTPVPASAVRGMVRLRMPFIALPAYWLRTQAWIPLGLTALVLLILLVVAAPVTITTEPENTTGTDADQSSPPHGRGRHHAGQISADAAYRPHDAGGGGGGGFGHHGPGAGPHGVPPDLDSPVFDRADR